MQITFGMHVDSWRGPGRDARIGRPVLGRPAFLTLLETHLGLTALPVSAARRAAAYMLALRAVDNPDRFFHRSLAVDELGTAVQLLAWRDELMLAGWDGRLADNWTSRLRDLAAAEERASSGVRASEGERLAQVTLRLRARHVPIDSVQLLDSVEAFPARWRDALELLPVVAQEAQVLPAAAGDLGRIQTACLQAVGQAQIVPAPAPALEGDGSLVVLRPPSREVAEHWLVDHCQRDAAANRLIVCEEHAASIDETLRVQGVPGCGFDEPSMLRPALQALPLALETLWDPVEPTRVLEFLMHPIGPFHPNARRMLGMAFAKQPGIGGREWSTQRAAIGQKLGNEVVQQIEYWLECPRSKRSEGAPLDEVIARVATLQIGLQSREKSLQQRQFDEALRSDMKWAIGQCSQFMEGLQELRKEGYAVVLPRTLEHLVAHATADSSNSLAIAQVGCMQSATTPAACSVEAANEVVWWMPAKPRLPAPLPWIAEELRAIADAGLRIRDPAAEMAALMAQWIRPILAARERLILVLPPEGTEDHPAWQLLRAITTGLAPQALHLYATARGQLAEVAARPLSAPRGVWELKQDANWREAYPVPTRRRAQSFTSLNTLFNNPAIAVLQDAAGLHATSTVAVPEGTHLLGKLAHRLLEVMFAQNGSLHWSEAQVDAWFGPAVDDLLRREGLPLLAAGNASLSHQFRESARGSIGVLLEHLRTAGAVRVEAERKLAGDLNGLETEGVADLLVQLESGGTLLLDPKWSPASRYREQMEKGDYLQLALYAHMIQQELGAAPVAIGFFSFVDRLLLTFTPNVFAATARVVTTHIPAAQLLQSAIESWNWRAQQWQEGRVEVIAKGLVPAATQPPMGCLPLGTIGDWLGEFEALFGQAEDA